ncbi:hypothetical protein SAMN05216178_6808 [Pseudomonas saponiphila]|uniref:Uncharacterized protein n=1 Tax=Pseudomonas saponiphila TaxID=556534 RepID=A0A1H4ZTG3_9PSED|nr:hypothetical protein [Pseudomonas saponiphila]SED32968.1 hypothetical protein SAMN05216178_6808 [Pseudomonas saponiphila]
MPSNERMESVLVCNGQVQISHHLDEIDAPVWPFMNDQAVKVGAKTGHIDNYRYELACGGVVALWDGNHLHALAVTVRDSMNRTRCVRVLASPKVEVVTACAVEAEPSDDVFESEFQSWWETEGQYVRAGGGDYEKSFAYQAWRHLYPRIHAASGVQPHTEQGRNDGAL